MNTLTVWSLMYCLTLVDGITWRDEDHTTNKMKKIVKGDDVKGYFTLTIGDTIKTFNNANKSEFLAALYVEVAGQLAKLISTPCEIVPIPSKSAVVGNTGSYPTLVHAQNIAQQNPGLFHVCDAFRWREPVAQAHRGGHRDPQLHAENLKIICTPTRPIVLFDDLITTGSQMIACSRKLKEVGRAPRLGLVIGQCTWDQKATVIAWESQEIFVGERTLRLG